MNWKQNKSDELGNIARKYFAIDDHDENMFIDVSSQSMIDIVFAQKAI